MKQGHVTGSKIETQGASDWYAHIAEQNIAAIEDTERALVTALATQVGNAVAAMPEAASRIAKAATLVQERAVWPMSDGTWLAGSQSDTELAYLVTRSHGWQCECHDHTKRGTTFCKHIISVWLTIKIGDAYKPCYN